MEVSGQIHAPTALLTGNIPGAYKIQGCVGSRIGLDDLENIKISCSFQDSNPGSSIPSLVTIPTTQTHFRSFLFYKFGYNKNVDNINKFVRLCSVFVSCGRALRQVC